MRSSRLHLSFLSKTPIPTSSGYSHAFADIKSLTAAIHRATREYFESQQHAERNAGASGSLWSALMAGWSTPTSILHHRLRQLHSGAAPADPGAMVSVYESIEIGRELSVRSVYKECRERARGRKTANEVAAALKGVGSSPSSHSFLSAPAIHLPAMFTGSEGGSTAPESDPFVEIVSRRKVAATLSGERQALAGVIVAITDAIDVVGYMTRFGVASDRFHKLPTTDDPLVDWLRKNGASCVGKLRCVSPFAYQDALAVDCAMNPISTALTIRSCHFCLSRSMIGCPGLTAVECGFVTFKPTTGSFSFSSVNESGSFVLPQITADAASTGNVLPISNVSTTAITATSVANLQHLWELFALSQDGHAPETGGAGGAGATAEEEYEPAPSADFERLFLRQPSASAGSATVASSSASAGSGPTGAMGQPLSGPAATEEADAAAIAAAVAASDESRFERNRDLAAVLAASSNFSTEGAEVLVGVPLSFIDTVAKFSQDHIGYFSGEDPDDNLAAPPAASYANAFFAHVKRLVEMERARFASSRNGLRWSGGRAPTRIEFVDVPLAIPHDSDILRLFELFAQYDLAKLFKKLTKSRNSESALSTGLLEELPQSTVTRIYEGLQVKERDLAAQRAEISDLQHAIAAAFTDVDVLCTPLLCPQYANTPNLRLLSLTLPFTLAGYPIVACPLARPVHAKLSQQSRFLTRSRVPVGDFAGMASGIQFVGEMGRDSALLEDSACVMHSFGIDADAAAVGPDGAGGGLLGKLQKIAPL